MATISEVRSSLKKLIQNDVKHSVMIWGAPGVGKSSAVKGVAKDLGLGFVDTRVSQLAPTDLRGLPYIEESIAKFAPPSFLPQSGEGILFLDELNMASPTMMGIAQQLILDRQVGDYTVPEGWFIVAAGNRTEDRAAVSQMPAPVANRFIHFTVEHDLASWKEYAIKVGISEQIVSFLNFRPELLFSFNRNATAWPSPRSWEFADSLHKVGLDLEHAIGDGAASEFRSYQAIYSRLPDIAAVLRGEKVKLEKEPSLIYASLGAIVSRAKSAKEYANGFRWLLKSTTEDYIGLYMEDAITAMTAKGLQGEFVSIVHKDQDCKNFLVKYQELLRG